MKKIIVYFFLTVNIITGQNINPAEELVTKAFNKLIDISGTSINFEYLFENNAHKMETPINGRLVLFSNNRFFLEFDEKEQKIIQIYNDNTLSTIIPIEQEIQIENLDENAPFFIQNMLTNYKIDFNIIQKNRLDNTTIIELEPTIQYNENRFNACIEKLKLPECLKLPNQCKIGILSKDKKLLDECLEEKQALKNNGISKIELIINHTNADLEVITQIDKYDGKTILKLKETKIVSEDILNIDSIKYRNFEIIDLR